MQTEGTTPDAQALRRTLGYISEAEVCALFGVTLLTLRNRQSSGSLPAHYKLGRQKLYRLVEVEAWIKRRRCARAVEEFEARKAATA